MSLNILHIPNSTWKKSSFDSMAYISNPLRCALNSPDIPTGNAPRWQISIQQRQSQLGSSIFVTLEWIQHFKPKPDTLHYERRSNLVGRSRNGIFWRMISNCAPWFNKRTVFPFFLVCVFDELQPSAVTWGNGSWANRTNLFGRAGVAPRIHCGAVFAASINLARTDETVESHVRHYYYYYYYYYYSYYCSYTLLSAP